jgi:hypothetical protein
MYPLRLVKIVLLLFFFSSLPVYGRPPVASKSVMMSNIRHIGKQLYLTAWEDTDPKANFLRASFFISKVLKGGSECLWWDTGMVLWGSRGGYRKMLDQHWLDQAWFWGVYAGYDVMSEFVTDISRLNLTPWLSDPTRVNLGFEVSAARWGQLTLNVYGEPYNPSQSPVAKDYAGLSAKASLNSLPFEIFPRVKPFGGFAFAWVGLPLNHFKKECLPSFILGAKWVANAWLDFELKYVYDRSGYQHPIHFGFKLKFDGVDPHTNYFTSLYNRPPNCYTPHYAYSVKLEELRMDAFRHRVPIGNSEDERIAYDSMSEDEINSPSTWSLAVQGNHQELAQRRSEANSAIIEKTLEDGTVLRGNPNVFNVDTVREADKLAKFMELDQLRKEPIINSVVEHQGNMRIEICGGDSKKNLETLLYTAPKNLVFTTQEPNGNGIGYGILGNGRTVILALKKTAIEIMNAMQASVSNNFVAVEATHTAPEGNKQTIYLVGASYEIQAAEQRAVAQGRLPPVQSTNMSMPLLHDSTRSSRALGNAGSSRSGGRISGIMSIEERDTRGMLEGSAGTSQSHASSSTASSRKKPSTKTSRRSGSSSTG